MILSCQESTKINVPYKNDQEHPHNNQNNEHDAITVNVKNTDAIISIGENNRHALRKIPVEEPDEALEINETIDDLEEIAPEELRELETKIKELKNIVLSINNSLNKIKLIEQKADQAVAYAKESIDNAEKANEALSKEEDPEKKREMELLNLSKEEIDKAKEILNKISDPALNNINTEKSAIETKIRPRVDYTTNTLKALEKALKELNESTDRGEIVENIEIELSYLEAPIKEAEKDTAAANTKIEDQQEKAEAAKKYIEDTESKNKKDLEQLNQIINTLQEILQALGDKQKKLDDLIASFNQASDKLTFWEKFRWPWTSPTMNGEYNKNSASLTRDSETIKTITTDVRNQTSVEAARLKLKNAQDIEKNVTERVNNFKELVEKNIQLLKAKRNNT